MDRPGSLIPDKFYLTQEGIWKLHANPVAQATFKRPEPHRSEVEVGTMDREDGRSNKQEVSSEEEKRPIEERQSEEEERRQRLETEKEKRRQKLSEDDNSKLRRKRGFARRKKQN